MKKMRKLFSVILIAALILVPVVPAQAAAPIQLNKAKASMYTGTRIVLSTGSKINKAIIWTSSNEKVAKVSKSGSIKAVKTGSATITAKLKGSTKKATCKITVGAYASKLSLGSAATVILEAGKSSRVKADVAPSNVLTSALTYASKDSKIAAVDKNGLITAVAEGSTQVVVKTKATGKNGKALTKTIQVIVNKAKDSTTPDGGSGGGGGTGGGTINTALINTITSGSTSTYVLNKAYTNSVTVSMTVNGQTWSYTGKVTMILDELSTTYTTRTNAAGTICATRNVGEEWWTITDPSNGNALLFKLKADMTYPENTAYGQIVIEQAGGAVSVSVQ